MTYRFSSSLKSQLKTVGLITIVWTVVSLFQFFIGYGTLIDMEYDFTGRDIFVHVKASLLTGILAGIMGGGGVVFLWEKWLRTKPYGWTLKSIFLSYTIIYILVAVPVGLFYQMNFLGKSLFYKEVWEEMFHRLLDPVSLIWFSFWLAIVICTMIALQVNDKYGPGVFKDFLLGKYFNPQREQRIFMFLDLRSSTRIAERLGEERYFNFLKEVYRLATPSILNNNGEIYQYVGDEIVISWRTGKSKDNDSCINCFFDIKRVLSQKAQYFKENFDEIPEFKAGLHYGYVMAGEIGVVKRDIVYSGDVLNTTARIQSKCNELGVDILISKYLVERLKLREALYELKEIGNIELRGKEEQVVLFTL